MPGLRAHRLAKGLEERAVMLKHSLKNAVNPVVTILAGRLAICPTHRSPAISGEKTGRVSGRVAG